MKPRLALASLVVLIAAVAVWFAVSERPPRGVVSDEPFSIARETALRAAEASANPAVHELAAAEASAASGEARAPVAVGPAGVLLVHVRANGAPVVGVEVRCSDLRGNQRSAGATDADGVARFEFVEAAEGASVFVAASATTAPKRAYTQRRFEGGAEHELVVDVDAGHVIAGVVEARGGPLDGRRVPHAIVELWSGTSVGGEPVRTATCDENGRFVLDRAPQDFAAAARADGYVAVRGLRGSLERDVDSEELVLLVAPVASLSGVVLDESGAPVEGARVEEYDGQNGSSSLDATAVPGIGTVGLGSGKAVTDASGRFEITGLPDERFAVLVYASGFLRFNGFFEADASPIEVRLDRGDGFTGRVIDANGAPAVGARVRWGMCEPSARPETRTDELGRFRAGGIRLPGGQYDTDPWVEVLHDGHAVQFVQPVDADRTGEAFVEVRLVRESVVAGVVLDESRKPVVNAAVWIEGEREIDVGYTTNYRHTWERQAGVHATTTDANGAFRLGHLNEGTYTLHASPPGDRRTVDVETEAGREDVEIVLAAAALEKVVIAGRAIDASTGAPLTKFRVVPMFDGSGKSNSFESPEGVFEVSGLPAGEITITARADGYANVQLPERAFEFGRHEVELRFQRLRQLVVFTEGVERASLRVIDGEGTALSIPHPGGEFSSTQVDVRDGRAALDGLPAAVVTVEVEHVDGVERVEVDLTADRLHEVVVPVKPFEQMTVWFAPVVLDAGAAAPQMSFPTDELARMQTLFPLAFANEPRVAVAVTVVDGHERVRATLELAPLTDAPLSIDDKQIDDSQERWSLSAWYPGINGGQGHSHTDLLCADALRLPRTKVTVTATAEGLVGEPVELDLTNLTDGALVPLPLRRAP
jgi:hypothetical protein